MNSGGTIKEFVELRIRIKSHVEKLHFAVTDLGKATMFIGHEWLKIHNPTIDWQQSTVIFNRCPEECMPLPDLVPDPDDNDEESGEWEVDPGDKLLFIDLHEEVIQRNIRQGNKTHIR